MDKISKIKILYFTDVLCVWAYLAQIRIDKLQQKYDARIDLHYHFIPVFGSVDTIIRATWNSKGGIAAYNKFVFNMTEIFDHVDIHPEIWKTNTPTTSYSCHLFLKAIQIMQMRGELPDVDKKLHRSMLETVIWEIRLAFFKNLVDISDFHKQMEVAEKLGIPLSEIEKLIYSGTAFSFLHNDYQLKEKYRVQGSPTLILNEGRQIIYGNVGYRVIEANVEELLVQPENQASWC